MPYGADSITVPFDVPAGMRGQSSGPAGRRRDSGAAAAAARPARGGGMARLRIVAGVDGRTAWTRRQSDSGR